MESTNLKPTVINKEPELNYNALTFYLEQLSPENLDLLQSRNPIQFERLIKQRKNDPNILGFNGVLTKLGKEIRDRSITGHQVVEELRHTPIEHLQDGKNEISEELAWSVWRWAQYSTDRKAKKLITLVRSGVVFGILSATAWIAGNLMHLQRTPDEQVITPTIPTLTATPLEVTPTMPTETSTPLPTATESPESGLKNMWLQIVEKHKRDKHDFLGSMVVDEQQVTDLSGFNQEVHSFLETNNMLEPNGSLNYNPGEPSEIYLWSEQNGNTFQVHYDGRHTSPPYVPHTFIYDLTNGMCQAVADEPMNNGSYQNSEMNFDPQAPANCVAVADTSSGRRIVVGFTPENGSVTIKAAIFSMQ